MNNKQMAYEVKSALFRHEFVPYFQPQFNHSTGMVVGAEVLARWIHPDKGLISPAEFIPVMEDTGYITNLDLYMFEEAAKHIKYCQKNGISPVPLAVNFSRQDIIKPDFIDTLEKLRKRHNIDTSYLKIEITESVAMENPEFIKDVVSRLNSLGYIVEIDDFGSGYSSLNVLKDIDFDVIKLDMKFISDVTENKRAGIILDSVIRMAQWLDTSVIAEGVETKKQADYFKSVGCDYIQGYLYSKPLPSDEYIAMLKNGRISNVESAIEMKEGYSTANFWDPESIDTLIFSKFVGPAAVFEMIGDSIRAIRVNEKYLKEFGMNMVEKDFINVDFSNFFDENNHNIFWGAFNKAAETNEEVECETWRKVTSECCGTEEFCIKSNVRLIGNTKESKLFYVMIRNITSEKQYMVKALQNELRFKAACEQAQIYYWEYNIKTKDMFPCFRCMRDLGLPQVVKNYPEAAIEAGIFPSEVADSYRDFMKKVDEGENMEGIYPLTVGRIPFHVRYTVERDEQNRPIRAYASATLVVEDK